MRPQESVLAPSGARRGDLVILLGRCRGIVRRGSARDRGDCCQAQGGKRGSNEVLHRQSPFLAGRNAWLRWRARWARGAFATNALFGSIQSESAIGSGDETRASPGRSTVMRCGRRSGVPARLPRPFRSDGTSGGTCAWTPKRVSRIDLVGFARFVAVQDAADLDHLHTLMGFRPAHPGCPKSPVLPDRSCATDTREEPC
jgi:hypothetical protein